MSTVILQVGQCGNQIGNEFWNVVNNDKANMSGHVYTHPDGYLRSVNVDSEPKVLHKLTQSNKLSIRIGNIQKGRRGRGSNWALGYYGTKNEEEDELLESTVDAIRKETERCSSFSGVVMVHSIGGGTGSGLGSRLCECLRDEYPLHQVMSCIVIPHTSGESPLQHYNSLLTLATLQRCSDCIVWFHNDEILSRLQKRSRKDPEAGISYVTMNQHIARCIAGVLLPTDTLTPDSGASIGQEPWEMLRSLTPMPSNKFVHVNSMNKSKLNWEAHCGLVSQELKRYDATGQPYISLCNLVIGRGDKTGSFPAQWTPIERKLKSVYNTVTWNPFPVEYWTAKMNGIGVRDQSSVTIASNHSSLTDHLTSIYNSARMKYDARAYLHWYDKFGCQQTDFDDAFHVIQDIMDHYQDVR